MGVGSVLPFGNSLSAAGLTLGPQPVGMNVGFGFNGRDPFWVNGGLDDDGNVVGADSNDGRTPGNALATIQEAVDRALTGDRILIFPGTYAENVVIDGKDYITLLGAIEARYGWPDIVPATGMALHAIQSQGLRLKQLRLSTEADSDVARIQGNGFFIKRVVLDGDIQGATKCLLRLRGNADDDSYTASEGLIRKCLFRGGGGMGLVFDSGDAPTNGVGCSDVDVVENIFQAITGADIGVAATGAGGAYSVQHSYIHKNRHRDKNKAVYIDMVTGADGPVGSQTGMISGDYFADDALDNIKVNLQGTGFTAVGLIDTVGVQDGSGLD